MDAQGIADAFADVVRRSGDEAGAAWLDGARRPATTAALRLAWGRAPRLLGDTAVHGPLPDLPEGPRYEAWPRRDFGRACVLLDFLGTAEPTVHVACVRELLARGEVGEQIAISRMLCVLPNPASHVDAAIDACRTNVVSLFEATACDNPYPALHFPQPAFRQLVMKSIFLGLPLARVAGLPERIDDELVRMAGDYADERRAAGRPVPDDIGTLMEARRR